MTPFEIRAKARDARPRRTWVGTLIRALTLALIAATVVVIAMLATERPGPPVGQRVQQASAQRQSDVELPSTNPSPNAASAGPSLDGDTSLSAVARMLDRLDESVVKIESSESGENRSLGSGFVVDARGLVATSFHVIADATSAVARFKNGAAYEVEGYAAVEPDLDLAIVKLRSPPTHLQPLELADQLDPARLSDVVAIGHPQGVEFSPFDGKVSRVLSTTELPASSQRFLRQLVSGRIDQRWIQHTAGISEGNSGGPLLNEQGQVIGINAWVDKQARFGYALHVSHLRQLTEEVGGEVEPLRKHARKEARVADLLRRLTSERFDELFRQAQRMEWRPESEADYEVLQQLAFAVTVVQLPSMFAAGQLDDRLDTLTRIADRIVRELEAQRWDAIGQMTIINEHAATQVDRALAGVFLFATIERIVEGDDGARGAILRMAGGDTVLFVPLDDQLNVPDAGQQCLVLGINYDGRKLRYGENPLRLITAHVIASRTLLLLR